MAFDQAERELADALALTVLMRASCLIARRVRLRDALPRELLSLLRSDEATLVTAPIPASRCPRFHGGLRSM
jgi:hypothetical protein